MNKKLKKGLTTTMAAAMGLGVVIPAVPVIAAPATSGWVNTAAGWTYLKSGVKATGWVKDAGVWYFLNSNGIMETGWVKDAGTWYYLNSNGAMATGWIVYKNAWYYLKDSGAMATGWVDYKGASYYLNAPNGDMAASTLVDGWYVDANGAWDGKAKYDLVAIEAAVKKAETTKAQADVDAAKALVNALPAVAEKDAFTKRLNAIVTTPEVSSVDVPNLTTVVVNFNKEVDATTATTPANYSIAGTTAATGSVKLNDDKKSVTITVSALANNANARVMVSNVKDATGVKVADFDKLVYVSDTTAPTVKSTSYSYANNLYTINFSEDLAGTPVSLVKVFDDSNVDVTGSIVAAPDAKTITVNTTTLTSGKTYKVVIYGAKDLAGNYFAGNKVETTFSKVKTDEVKPTITSLDVKNNSTIRVQFSEAIKVGASDKIADLKLDDATTATTVASKSTLSAAGDAVDVNGDGKTWDIKVKGTGISGAAKVSLVNFSDLEGNVQDTSFDKLVTFAADTTAPTVVSTKTVGSKLYVTYDEAVAVKATLAANDVQIVTPASVLKDVYATSTVTLDATDKTNKTVIVDLGANIAAAGSYTVKLASGVVSDTEATPNTKAYDYAATFTTAADSSKPTLYMTGTPAVIDATAVVQSTDNKYVTVKFSEKMDSSALVSSNYLIDGVAAFDGAIFVGDTDTVRLTLKAGAVSVTGDHQVTVSGVKDLAGNAIDTVTTIENLKENLVPTVTKLTIVNGTTLQLTFSEGITNNDTTADLQVKVNGADVTETTTTATAGNTVTITLGSALPSLTTPISVKVLDTNDIKDGAGNGVATQTLTLN